MRIETEQPAKTNKVTPELIRETAGHVASQFGTRVDPYKDLMAAANALQAGDVPKAERILGFKLQS